MFLNKQRHPIYLLIVSKVLSVVAMLFFVIASFYIFNFVVDDSFISLLYARNLAVSGELAANIGERIFGFTNFLFVIIEAGIIKLFQNYFDGFAIIIPIKLFLFICALFSVLLPWRYTPFKNSPIATAFWFVSIASATPFIVWTAGGLETSFLTLLLVITAISFLNATLCPNKKYWEVVMLLASSFAILTRLDIVLVVMPIILAQGLNYLRKDRGWRIWFAIFFIFVLPIIAMIIFTYTYYGKPLPQAFYLKAFKGIRLYGILYFLEFLFLMNMNFIHVLLTAIGLKKAYSPRIPQNQCFEALRAYIPILAGLALYVLYIVNQGPVHMMFSYRFYAPLLPLLYMASTLSIAAMTQIKETTSSAYNEHFHWELLVKNAKTGGWRLVTLLLTLGFVLGLIVLWSLINLPKYILGRSLSSVSILGYLQNYFILIALYAGALLYAAWAAAFPQKRLELFKNPRKLISDLKQKLSSPYDYRQLHLFTSSSFIVNLSIILLILNIASFIYAYKYNMTFSLTTKYSGDLHTMSIKEYEQLMSYFKVAGESIRDNFSRDTKMYSWSAGIIPYIANVYSFDNLLISTKTTSKLSWNTEDIYEPFDVMATPNLIPKEESKFTLWKTIPKTITTEQARSGVHQIYIYSKYKLP